MIYCNIFNHLTKKKTIGVKSIPLNPKSCPMATLKQYVDIRLLRLADTVVLISQMKLYKGHG